MDSATLLIVGYFSGIDSDNYRYSSRIIRGKKGSIEKSKAKSVTIRDKEKSPSVLVEGNPAFEEKGARKGHQISRSDRCRRGLDGDELLKCLWKAWEKGKSWCEGLDITFREKTEDAGIFLFESKEVQCQFLVPIEVIGPIPKLEPAWDMANVRVKSGEKRGIDKVHTDTRRYCPQTSPRVKQHNLGDRSIKET